MKNCFDFAELSWWSSKGNVIYALDKASKFIKDTTNPYYCSLKKANFSIKKSND